MPQGYAALIPPRPALRDMEDFPPLTMHRLLVALVVLLTAQTADAQIWRRARDAARRGIENAVDRRAERAAEAAVDALFDAGEDAARCVFTDDACIRAATEAGEDVVLTDADGTPVDRSGRPVTEANAEDAVVRAPGRSASGAASGTSARPGEGAWANYDFVPGDRVLFFDDFEDTYVGNVPGSVEFVRGTMEVVAEGGGQALRLTEGSAFEVVLGETMPERFTVEFDAFVPYHMSLCVLTQPLENRQDTACGTSAAWEGATRVQVGGGYFSRPGFLAPGGSPSGTAEAERYAPLNERYVPVRIAVDGRYVKVYLDETRVVNIPNAVLNRTDRLVFIADDGYAPENETTLLVDNLRVAAGGREILYDRLQADGRLALGGLLFDTASARLRPESTPTLLDLELALTRHADLRLRIEGHTDDTGAADANLRLSQQRAEAVVAWLVGRGVDAGRLEAAGLGDAQPVADNATAAGRQTNRRVEAVRL